VPQAQTEGQSKNGIRITLYKSVISDRAMPKRKDFLLWGASSFLYIDLFQSLSEISQFEDGNIDLDDLNEFPLTENRYIYLYKDHTANLFPEYELDWIFHHLPDQPLIVITLVKADLKQISSKIEEIANVSLFQFDIYKTLGQEIGVIVFRCNSYSPVMDCIVQLNAISKNTYSIAGIENSNKTRGKSNHLIELKGAFGEAPEICASINYLLKEGNVSRNRVENAVRKIASLKKRAVQDLGISERDLEIQVYYEIGRFDVEVRIEGHIEHVLELLLNPHYGLSNYKSEFYRKHVFESQTTWKTVASIK
jgi:hypothetical protein